MKRLMLSIALIVGTLSTYAQHHGKSHDKGEHMEKRLAKMTENLSLTADQQAKVKSLMTTQKEKMKEEKKENREEFDKEMKNILSDEQYTKWVAQCEEMRKKHQERKVNHKD